MLSIIYAVSAARSTWASECSVYPILLSASSALLIYVLMSLLRLIYSYVILLIVLFLSSYDYCITAKGDNEAVAKTQQPALLLIDFYYLSEFYSHTVAFAFIQ